MSLPPEATAKETLSPEERHQPDVVPSRPIAIASVVLVLVLVLGYLIPTALEYQWMAREAQQSAPANPLAEIEGRRLPPAPRLQVNPVRDMAELRRAEDRVLNGYAWVDEEAGIARIPIDRAMAIVAEKGLPPAAPTPAPGAGS